VLVSETTTHQRGLVVGVHRSCKGSIREKLGLAHFLKRTPGQNPLPGQLRLLANQFCLGSRAYLPQKGSKIEVNPSRRNLFGSEVVFVE